MPTDIRPHMMFIGDAEEAINLYVEVFDSGELRQLERWGPDEEGEEDTIKHAIFTLDGREFSASDSPPIHDFTFTPSLSIFVECEGPDQLERLYDGLSDGGEVLMPLDSYEFSTKFAWLNDRFGVSWQLNLP